MMRTSRHGAIRAGIAGVSLAVAAGLVLGSAPGPRPVAAQTIPPPAPVSARAMEVVGHHDLGQTAHRTSDVWLLNGIAYLGYRCNAAKGSSIVDVKDPTSPKVLFQAPLVPGAFTDDVFALHVDTPAFEGDLFVEPFDQCAAETGAVTRFWNVTDPASPVLLSTFFHGDGAHNSFAFQRGANAYVVLAMPGGDVSDNTQYGFEDRDLDADFAIVDITDPRNPTLASTWNAHATWTDLPGSTFQHDVWVNKSGTMAYGAYWDAGMILVDITDVTDPKPISRFGYSDVAAGDTHQVVPTKNEDYAVLTDEDFDPTAGIFEVISPPALVHAYRSTPGGFADMLMNKPPLEGDLVWVGRGCDADPDYNLTQPDPYLHDPTGRVAVIVRGGCTFAGKIQEAQKNGAIGAIIVNSSPGGPAPMGGRPRQGTTIPGIGITYDDGHAITTTLEAGTMVRARFGIGGGEWGYTRFVDIRDPRMPKQVAEYTIPETRQFPPADGNFTVHNAWVDGDTLYLSHYDAGVRMLDISDPTMPRETGYLVPAKRDVAGTPAVASVWGVMTDERGLVYASDMTNGLWILCAGDGCARTWARQPPTPTATLPATSLPPVQTPTAQPTAVPPLPTPQTGNVCPQIANKVPAAAINAALANPARVYGYNKPQDFGKPPHPIYNRLRTWLSIRTYAKPFHPLFNSLEYKVGCP